MNKQTDWYLGIDLGTGSCKCVAINQNGQVLGTSSSVYPHPDFQNNWKEQDPGAIFSGMVNAIQSVIQESDLIPKNCRSVSIGCALHGLLALDKSGNPLTPVYTWADDRAASQAARIKTTSLAENLITKTGCPPHGMYPLYKIQYLRENKPEIFNRSARFVSIKEYFTTLLTQETLVDYSMASGTGLLNIETLDWFLPALDLAGIKTDQLSTPSDPKTQLSITDKSFLTQTGLPTGVPIILGSTDAVNSNLGAGAVEPWQATCMIGTSGAYRIIAPKPMTSAEAGTWCYCIDQENWLVGGAINNGGLALNWLQDALQAGGKNVIDLSIEDLLFLAKDCEPGSGGVICLPLFAGERSPNWNLDAKALFIGLSLEHDLRHLTRSLLEGVAFRLRHLDEILRGISGEIREVRASGGYTRSDFWTQMVCDVIGHPLLVPAVGDTSALGAALWALCILPEFNTLKDLGSLMQIEKTYQPDAKNRPVYERAFELFKGLYQANSPFFSLISDYQIYLKKMN